MARYNVEFRKSEFTHATNVIAEQGSGVKTYRWVKAGTVMIASHGVITQSTIYIPGSLEWSPVHMYSTVPTCMCGSRARRFRHCMGMMGGHSSVTLHSICDMKYAGAQGMSYSSFMRHATTSRVDSTPKKRNKSDILLISEIVRPRDGSGWVWGSTVVIADHD